jgi:hypothetical protein
VNLLLFSSMKVSREPRHKSVCFRNMRPYIDDVKLTDNSILNVKGCV